MSEQDNDTDDVSSSMHKYEWEMSNGYTYQFKTISEMLKKIMQHIEETRNDDAKLRHVVWKRVQDLDLNEWEDFQKTINAESIRRARQQIQSDLEYIPTEPSVLYQRGYTLEEVQEYYEIKKPQIPHKYLDYLGEKVKDGEITEEELEEKYIGDIETP